MKSSDERKAKKKQKRQLIAVELWQGHRDFAWAQFRAIAIVQIAFFAGYWATVPRTPSLSFLILIVGSVLMIAIRMLIGRHFEHSAEFRRAAGKAIPKPSPAKFFRSDTIAKLVIDLLVAVNFVIALASWHFFREYNKVVQLDPACNSTGNAKSYVRCICSFENLIEIAVLLFATIVVFMLIVLIELLNGGLDLRRAQSPG